jgi:hypothetical protein
MLVFQRRTLSVFSRAIGVATKSWRRSEQAVAVV